MRTASCLGLHFCSACRATLPFPAQRGTEGRDFLPARPLPALHAGARRWTQPRPRFPSLHVLPRLCLPQLCTHSAASAPRALWRLQTAQPGLQGQLLLQLPLPQPLLLPGLLPAPPRRLQDSPLALRLQPQQLPASPLLQPLKLPLPGSSSALPPTSLARQLRALCPPSEGTR